MFCSDCHGIGHNMEQCTQKRFKVAQRKIQPWKVWVPKDVPKPALPTVVTNVVATIVGLPTADEHSVRGGGRA